MVYSVNGMTGQTDGQTDGWGVTYKWPPQRGLLKSEILFRNIEICKKKLRTLDCDKTKLQNSTS